MNAKTISRYDSMEGEIVVQLEKVNKYFGTMHIL